MEHYKFKAYVATERKEACMITERKQANKQINKRPQETPSKDHITGRLT